MRKCWRVWLWLALVLLAFATEEEAKDLIPLIKRFLNKDGKDK